MAEAPLCLIKAGATYPDVAARLGDFEDWLIAGLGLPPAAVRVLVPGVDELPPPGACAGVAMTGAHAMVSDWTPWMVRLADWLRRVVEAEVPYLGICFGHQLLARALGGRVDYHPRGREIGTVDVHLLPAAETDPLFADLPARFPAHAVHAQTVTALPPGAVPLAGNPYEPTHAFRIGARAWGVQFHPEFDRDRMTAYLERLANDPAGSRAGARDTPAAAGLLPAFARLARGRP